LWAARRNEEIWLYVSADTLSGIIMVEGAECVIIVELRSMLHGLMVVELCFWIRRRRSKMRKRANSRQQAKVDIGNDQLLAVTLFAMPPLKKGL